MTSHPFQIELNGPGNGFECATMEIEIANRGGQIDVGRPVPADIAIKNLNDPDSKIEITSIGGLPGADGRDAYQVAVANGYPGTLEEWLNSLKGPYEGIAWHFGHGEPGLVPGAKPGDIYVDVDSPELNWYKLGD